MCNIKQILLFLFCNQVSKSLNHLLSLLKKKNSKGRGQEMSYFKFSISPYLLRMRLNFLLEIPHMNHLSS